MPKYKDGATDVQLGDRARGPCGTHPALVEGIVIGVDSERCQLSFAVPFQPVPLGLVNVSLANGWAAAAECERVEPAPWSK